MRPTERLERIPTIFLLLAKILFSLPIRDGPEIDRESTLNLQSRELHLLALVSGQAPLPDVSRMSGSAACPILLSNQRHHEGRAIHLSQAIAWPMNWAGAAHRLCCSRIRSYQNAMRCLAFTPTQHCLERARQTDSEQKFPGRDGSQRLEFFFIPFGFMKGNGLTRFWVAAWNDRLQIPSR
jgi:hypothetical protein